MKVCTEASLLGAWTANTILNLKSEIAVCLDVGTGTGLLSLMLAQKIPVIKIDAVEIEENACEQAKENFGNSHWNDRLNIFHADIKNFPSKKKYDLIICNPPFYENELRSNEKNKNIAKHDQGLILKDLIEVVKTHLAVTGSFAVLLPFYRLKYFEELARENELFLKEKLLVRQTATHNFFRGILFFSRQSTSSSINELTIKDVTGNYTSEFIELLKDYYLKL